MIVNIYRIFQSVPDMTAMNYPGMCDFFRFSLWIVKTDM